MLSKIWPNDILPSEILDQINKFNDDEMLLIEITEKFIIIWIHCMIMDIFCDSVCPAKHFHSFIHCILIVFMFIRYLCITRYIYILLMLFHCLLIYFYYFTFIYCACLIVYSFLNLHLFIIGLYLCLFIIYILII